MRRARPSRALACIAFLAAIILAPAASRAGVLNSPHDLSTTGPFTKSNVIAPQGVCSACHIPHGADLNNVLWARNLAPYGGGNLANDGSSSSIPNYVSPPTIQCYDCHDYHSGSSPSNLPNNVPAIGDFTSTHKPQNIAAGFTRNNAPGVYNSSNMTEDAWGGSVSGYYENKPPYSSDYGANPGLAPTDPPYPSDNTALLKTGGHYFKRKDPRGGAGTKPDIGDKLSCRDCHNPHEWASNWQAFMRRDMAGASRFAPGGNATASTYMANDFTSSGARNDRYSRFLCIACHGDSNSLGPVSFSAINPDYSSSEDIVRPPNSIVEHGSASDVACVKCHTHNTVDASCSDCHGNPPPGYPTGRNPEGGVAYGLTPEQTHARHHGHFSDNLTQFSSYSYDCAVCHANSSLHQNNNVNVVYDFSFMGKDEPPSFQPFTGSTYVRTTCANVYCHSLGFSDNSVNPIVPPSTTVQYFRSVTWGAPTLGCNGCHGTTTTPGTMRYGMPEHNSGAGGSPSANSHKAHVENNGYECSVCHFNTVEGTYSDRRIRGTGPPVTTNAYHVNGNAGGPGRDIAFDTSVVTGTPTYTQDNGTQSRNKRCGVSCHRSEALPVLSQPQWGNPGSATCTACHVTSAADSDAYLAASNTWFQDNVAANLDNTEWTWSGHGRPSASGNYDVSGRPAAALLDGGTGDNPCLYCHNSGVGHKQPTNPFRLVWQEGVDVSFVGLGWNATCLVCHRKTTPRPGYDPDNSATVYASQVATAAFVDNNHWGTEHGNTNSGKFCWDCHDPHGDRNSSGTGNIFMIHKQQLARQTEGTYGYPGTSGALSGKAPVFTNVTTGTNYADNVNYTGICQVCHTLASTSHYRYNLGDGHYATSRCTTCHIHDMAFAPSKCDACHGGENGELDPVNGAPKVTRYWKTKGHGHASGPAVTCDNCHDVSSPSPSTHTTTGSGVFNTYQWPGKPADTTDNNTVHLKSYYLRTLGTPSQVQIKFDDGCYYGPQDGTACHAQRYYKNHRHTKNPTANEVRFGRANTNQDPKAFTWYTPGSYDSDFYMSRSPWVITDVTDYAGEGDPNPPSTPYYGVCVSCHDPHGTATTDTTLGGLGLTNHMVRGNWVSEAGQFCNGACHK